MEVGLKISEAVITVLDCETTGLDPRTDRIVEFACRDSLGNEFSTMVNPGISIPCDVSAVTHIVDDDLIDAPSLEEAMTMIGRAIPEGNVLCAFNVRFDSSFLPVLNNPENPRKWLCAYRLSRHLYPQAPKHTNQCMRYMLGGAKIDLRGQESHRALADVIVTQFVLGKLIEKYLMDGHEDDVDALLAFAAAPIRVETFPFGKHFGKKIESAPSDYLQWCLREMKDLDPDLRLQFQELLRR